jgi:RNA polymerase sigma-70 factor (ECF subfamily)
VGQSELVERAARGDAEAFTRLAAASVARLDAAARLILRDPEWAKDAVQETFARAWRDIPRLRDPDRFEAWLHRLLANVCRDLLRRQRRRPIEVELPDVDGPATGDAFAIGLDRDQLERALRRLTPEHRALIVLRFYLDMPLADAAAQLGIPEGTAKSRLHRSLQEMRSALEADERHASLSEGRPA